MHKRNICVRILAGKKILQLNKVKIQSRYKNVGAGAGAEQLVLGSSGAGA